MSVRERTSQPVCQESKAPLQWVSLNKSGDIRLKRLILPHGIKHLGQTVALACTPWTRKGSTEQITDRAGVPFWNVRLNSLLGGEFWVRVPSALQPVDLLPSYVQVEGITVSAFRDELSFEATSLTVLPESVAGMDA